MVKLQLPIRLVLLGSLVTSMCGAFACSDQHRGKPEPTRPAQPQRGQEFDFVEVRFRSADNRLAGVLYLPKRAGLHPAVALVLGSGPADRGYRGVGPALASHFARHGVACLAWDQPGVGQSTGDYQTQTFRDRAEEALAAVAFLRERPDIRADAVGLWGHSQGGAVVPLAASLSRKVAFLIDIAGWHGPAWQQDLVRVEAEFRADGAPASEIAEAVAFANKRMDLIRGDQPFEALDRAQQVVQARSWFPYVHGCDAARFYWARRMVGEDTGRFWEGVGCPVLAIYGDKDTSTGRPEPVVAVIRRGLEKTGNKDVTVRIFANADHSLCRTETGGRKEKARRAATRKDGGAPDFVPGYLDAMTEWLGKRFPPGR